MAAACFFDFLATDTHNYMPRKYNSMWGDVNVLAVVLVCVAQFGVFGLTYFSFGVFSPSAFGK